MTPRCPASSPRPGDVLCIAGWVYAVRAVRGEWIDLEIRLQRTPARRPWLETVRRRVWGREMIHAQVVSLGRGS